MRKTILAAVLAITAFAAGNAMAFDNISVGDTATGTNAGGISFGSYFTCNNSTISGPVKTDNGTDAGGVADLTSASFTNCTDSFGGHPTITSNASTSTPWTLSMDGAGSGAISNISFILMMSGTDCLYTGSISLQYDAADWGGNGDAPLSGSLTRQSGGFPCTSTMSVTGTYNIVGPNGAIDL